MTKCRNAGEPIEEFLVPEEVEYLGYKINREGIKPQAKKIEKILALRAPKNKTELCGFVGMVNYYQDMWKVRSSMLAPLTSTYVRQE